MSRVVLHDLLRGELGFSGVVVSDALDMAGASGSLGMAGAAVAALQAGCDLLCLGTENTDDQLADIERAVSSAVAEGALASDRVSEAASRVRGLAEDLIAARRGSRARLLAPRRAGPVTRPSWSTPSMSNLEHRTGGRGHRADTPSCALRRIPISPLALHPGGLSPARGIHQRSRCMWSHPSNRRCRPFNPINPYSSLGATSTGIPLPEKLLTGCVPNMLMCWSSTWVGHRTTAGTPTWPRSAHRA